MAQAWIADRYGLAVHVNIQPLQVHTICDHGCFAQSAMPASASSVKVLASAFK